MNAIMITTSIIIIVITSITSMIIMIGVRLINIGDREDEEGIRWSFELCQRDQQRVILKVIPMMTPTMNAMMMTLQADNGEEKQAWMAALVMLNTKSMLERTLDVILR